MGKWVPRGSRGPLGSQTSSRNFRKRPLSVNINLNKKIGGARKVEEIHRIISENVKVFNIVNCSTALQRLAKFGDLGEKGSSKSSSSSTEFSKENLKLLSDQTVSILSSSKDNIEPRHLSTILWACGRMRRSELIQLVEIAVQVIQDYRNQLNSQESSVVIWSLGRIVTEVQKNKDLAVRMQNLAFDILEANARHLDYFTTQGIANICWGIANVSRGEASIQRFRKLSKDILYIIEKKAFEFKCQEISNVLWSFAKLKLECTPAFATVAAKVIKQIKANFSPQQLANVSWGLTHLKDRSNGTESILNIEGIFFNDIHQRVHEFNGQELSMLCWVVAVSSEEVEKLNNSDSEEQTTSRSIMLSLQGQALKLMKNLNAHQISGILWAAGRQKCAKEEYVRSSLESLLSQLDKLNAQDMDSIVWACARLEYKDSSFFKALVEECIKIFDKAQQVETKTLSPKNLSNIVWGLGKMKVKGMDRFALKAADNLTGKVEDFNPRDLSNFAWGFANIIGAKQDDSVRQLFNTIADAAQKRIEDFNAQECSKLLWAMDKVKVKHQGLLESATSKRLVEFKFDSMKEKISIEHIVAGGRNLTDGREETGATAATGGALWESSFVLADWFSRFLCRKHSQRQKLEPSMIRLPIPVKILLEGFVLPKGSVGVEIGAGLGLASIVAKKCTKIRILATDGDLSVLSLLKRNCEINQSKVKVRKLKWGAKDVMKKLKLKDPPSIIFGSGIVYGKDKGVFRKLHQTITDLAGSETIVLLAHGQGAAPGVHDGSGFFFDTMKEEFEIYKLPFDSLHRNHRNGSNVIHLLIKKKETLATKDEKKDRSKDKKKDKKKKKKEEKDVKPKRERKRKLSEICKEKDLKKKKNKKHSKSQN